MSRSFKTIFLSESNGQEKEIEENGKLKDDKSSASSEEGGDQENHSHVDQELKQFFKKDYLKSLKKKKNKTTQENKAETSYSKPVQKQNENELNFNCKTFKAPLNLGQLKKYDRPELWQALNENSAYESLINYANSNADTQSSLNPIESSEFDFKKGSSKIVLECTNDENLILYPELLLNPKTSRKNTTNMPPHNSINGVGGGVKSMDSIWLHDFQMWKFNRSGFIYSQFFPKLCLTLNTSITVKLEIRLKNPAQKQRRMRQSMNNDQESSINKNYQDKTRVIYKKGYVIGLGTRNLNESSNNYKDKDQQWHFNKRGNIYSKALEDKQQMVLTSKDLLLRELNSASGGLVEGYDLQIADTSSSESSSLSKLSPDQFSLLLLENFEEKLPRIQNSLSLSQRWSIKQENSRSIGEWRFSELSTSRWHKLALTWPVNEKEELIDTFKWPICGALMPGAPPLRDLEKEKQQKNGGNNNTRLKVLRNGSLELPALAACITRQDAKNLMKNFIHCTKITYRQFEFQNFLSQCSQVLGLPSAARRLFDSDGIEHHDLANLKQDQLVYVSMGESLAHPKLIKEEQERKSLLSGLSDDLIKIGYFNKLKLCRNFVIECSAAASPSSPNRSLVINQCCLTQSQIDRIKQGESIKNVIENDEDDENESDEEDETPKTAHEKSHQRIDELETKKFRWPWDTNQKADQNQASNENGEATKSNEADVNNNKSSIDESLLKPNPKKHVKNVRLSMQKFAYNKTLGYIYNIDNPNLVFGIHDGENGLNEVFLMKKNDDNINQRWILKSNGNFLLKGRSNMALTVKLPPIESSNIKLNSDDNDEESNSLESIYSNASLVIQPLVDFENGNAHQIWFIDEEIGFIYAFATSEFSNIEVMAANKANICTHYVVNDKEISQPVRKIQF